MTDKIDNETSSEESSSIDLNDLKSLSFGPAWSSQTTKTAIRHSGTGGSPKQYDTRQKRTSTDRRPNQARFTRRHEPQEPQIEYAIAFYPEDGPFKALTKAMRTSGKTYQLFEIADLILEKEDRFTVAIEKLDNKNPHLFISLPDKMPFNTEQEALTHISTHHIERFFELNEIEVEPPKGNFPTVNRCGITKKLLGPPNYHRYQQLLQQHHAANLADIPYDRFVQQIVAQKDPETVNEWLQSMTKETQYVWKNKMQTGEEPIVFNTLEAAKNFLLLKKNGQIIKKVDYARCPGRNIAKFPQGNLKNKIIFELDRQRKFPLDTANNLRGRLRKLKLHIYKKGSEGISYVSAIKRNFRKPGTIFSESIQSLISFLEENPKINASDLPEKHLGFKHCRNTDNSTLSPEQQALFNQLMVDLRWVVSEGYVIEYGDGTLLAVPPMPIAKSMRDDIPEFTKTEDTAREKIVVEPKQQATEAIITEQQTEAAVEIKATIETSTSEEPQATAKTETAE